MEELAKKNVELEEVRDFRKKLNEKEIIAAIEKLDGIIKNRQGNLPVLKNTTKGRD